MIPTSVLLCFLLFPRHFFPLPTRHFPLPHSQLSLVSSEGVPWGEFGESQQSCPPQSFKDSKFHTVYPTHLPLSFLTPVSWKGQWYLKLLVALGGEAINLSVIICNHFRSNNPFVQAFLRSLLSRRGEWKVGDIGKSQTFEISPDLRGFHMKCLDLVCYSQCLDLFPFQFFREVWP